MKTLIKVTIIGSIIFFGISLIGKYSPSSAEETTTYASASTLDYSDLLTEVKKESKVIDAVVSDMDVLYVSVIDDGTKRDGYAEYLCESIAQFHTKIDRVKVIKANSKKTVLLGESWCK